jgi:hypothetical protein
VDRAGSRCRLRRPRFLAEPALNLFLGFAEAALTGNAPRSRGPSQPLAVCLISRLLSARADSDERDALEISETTLSFKFITAYDWRISSLGWVYTPFFVLLVFSAGAAVY